MTSPARLSFRPWTLLVQDATPMPPLIIALVVLSPVILLVVWGAWTYNRLVRARNQSKEAWSGIDVQLKRRHDLVPVLVESVKAYQSHEKDLLEAVVQHRAAAQNAKEPNDASQAEQALAQDLGRVVALVESYPELKADQNFLDLMGQLVDIEDHIQFARRYYNGSVRDLNNAVQQFPTNLLAGFYGFQEIPFFELESVKERLPPQLAETFGTASPSKG